MNRGNNQWLALDAVTTCSFRRFPASTSRAVELVTTEQVVSILLGAPSRLPTPAQRSAQTRVGKPEALPPWPKGGASEVPRK